MREVELFVGRRRGWRTGRRPRSARGQVRRRACRPCSARRWGAGRGRGPWRGRTWSAASGLRRHRPAGTTPSTMLRIRSTSPPKSAWPGVSTMLMRRPLPFDRGAFGEDGDAAFAFDVVAVHRAFGDGLACRGRHPDCFRSSIDQRGLAVVNVGDDRDVAKVHVSAISCCAAAIVELGREGEWGCGRVIGRLPGHRWCRECAPRHPRSLGLTDQVPSSRRAFRSCGKA